jgi:hypothetical protein
MKSIILAFLRPNSIVIMGLCGNPSFGLVTKAKACKVASQEGSPRITSRAPDNAKECEGMNLHTPK